MLDALALESRDLIARSRLDGLQAEWLIRGHVELHGAPTPAWLEWRMSSSENRCPLFRGLRFEWRMSSSEHRWPLFRGMLFEWRMSSSENRCPLFRDMRWPSFQQLSVLTMPAPEDHLR